jgi:hypothetical protein
VYVSESQKYEQPVEIKFGISQFCNFVDCSNAQVKATQGLGKSSAQVAQPTFLLVSLKTIHFL